MNATEVLQFSGGIVRGTARTTGRIVRLVVTETAGLVMRVQPIRRRAKPGMDDVTLARKVETEIFRGSRAPKSSVNVNVVDGVVWLRGEVKTPRQIKTLEAKALAIPEVRGVENLLHLPKTPASTRADTPRRQQRTRSSTKRPAPGRTRRGRVTDDRTDAIVGEAEPSPAEHAREHEGRSPAPFGAQGEAETETQTGATAAGDGGAETEGQAPSGAETEAPAATSQTGNGGAAEPSTGGNGGGSPEPATTPPARQSAEQQPGGNGGGTESAGEGEGVGSTPGAGNESE